MSRRRERLITPLALTVVALCFGAAFLVLAPILRDSRPTDIATDQLSIAYLKARAESGDLTSDEVHAAILALIRENKLAAAERLRLSKPADGFDSTQRLMLDLELAVARVRTATAAGPIEGARVDAAQLFAVARADMAQLSVAQLERASELAVELADANTAAALYQRLAVVQTERASDWFGRCARVLKDDSVHATRSLECFERARRSSENRAERFALSIDMLERWPDNDALAQELIGDDAAGIGEREALVPVLLAGERPLAAARLLAGLAEEDPTRRVDFTRRAAQWAEAAEQPELAAVYLGRITEYLPRSERRQHLARLEALLIGAGRTDKALQSVQARLEQDDDNPDLLRAAISLARQSGETERAFAWCKRLLAIQPEDRDVRLLHMELAQATGRLDQAQQSAEIALRKEPDDRALRARLARLAEWNQKPAVALRHWRRLALDTTDREALRETSRLAEALRYAAVAADAALELALQSPADRDVWLRIAALYELDGRPDDAAKAMERLMTVHGESAQGLRDLAALHQRHVRYREALAVWERFTARYGRGSEETLARSELHWRLSEPEPAVDIAMALAGRTLPANVSDYQVRLLAEIGWRYRLPRIAEITRTRLPEIEKADERRKHGERAIDDLQRAGREVDARRLAEEFWRKTGDEMFALRALRLAVESGEKTAARRLLADTADVEGIRNMPSYWSLRATMAVREGNLDAGERAYRTALGIAPDHVDALGGLLWLLLDRNDLASIGELLDTVASRAIDEPTLWAVLAVAHLQSGLAEAGLPWFELALQHSPNDYGLWLSYADALERVGDVDAALAIRRHAVAALRPRLLAGSQGKRDQLLRQYGRVLARHGSAADNESWMNYVLNAELAGEEGSFWREDMAISWLMSTERHERARLLMMRLHEQRLASPPWQDMALALRADDEASIAALLASGRALSDGNRIMALRALGRDGDAFALALRTLIAPQSDDDRRVAYEQYATLRQHRPRDVSIGLRQSRDGDMASTDKVFSARYSFLAEPGDRWRLPAWTQGTGVGIDVARRDLHSDELNLSDRESESELSLSLFRDSDRQRMRVTVGFTAQDDNAMMQAGATVARRDASGRRGVRLDVAWNEIPDESTVLRLAGRRHRAGVELDTSMGSAWFARVRGDLAELGVRESDAKLAQGVLAQAQIGLRGRNGLLDWSSSLLAEGVAKDRVSDLPDALRLRENATVDSVLIERASAISINASIARGGLSAGDSDSSFGGSSLRYFVNAGLGPRWPGNAVSLQVDAGAGIRVLGNDEIAFRFSHGERLGVRRDGNETSSFAVDYRYRF